MRQNLGRNRFATGYYLRTSSIGTRTSRCGHALTILKKQGRDVVVGLRQPKGPPEADFRQRDATVKDSSMMRNFRYLGIAPLDQFTPAALVVAVINRLASGGARSRRG